MNKLRFRLKNYLLASRFIAAYPLKKLEFPDILDELEKKYGIPIFMDPFHDLQNWYITHAGEWGSARPDNLCTYVQGNVAVRLANGQYSLVIKTTPDSASGKDWEGNEVTRPISSGLIRSNFLVRPGQVISATVNTSGSYAGSWFAFWLMRKEEAGEERYREVDIFEKFMEKPSQKRYTMTVHGGTQQNREMMNFHYPLFFVNERRLTFTCELEQRQVRVSVNGIPLFLAEEPDFDGEYYVVFDDAPTTHGGKVREEDIIKVLPRSFEIVDFRIYGL